MKIKGKRAVVLAMTLAMVITMTDNAYRPEDVEASDLVIYDYMNMTTYADRTIEDVVSKYNEAVKAGATYEDGNESTYYSLAASIKAPYCQGILTDDTLKEMQGMTDFYRWLVGGNALKTECVQNQSLQYQALDRNFEFNHYISDSSKPSDMDSDLWNKGSMMEHNILSGYATPLGSITNWMNEGYNLKTSTWDTVGHRYALINPWYTDVQFGYCGVIGIGDVVDSHIDTSQNWQEVFAAFPAAGYMPSKLVNPSECAWTFSYNPSTLKLDNEADIKITVTNKTTGKSYECSVSKGTAKYYSEELTGGNTIGFVQPSDYEGSYTDTYNVLVEGLTDIATGKEARVSYDVIFFDISKLEDATVEKVNCENFEDVKIYSDMASSEGLSKIASLLPSEVVAKSSAGIEYKLSVTGAWTVDATNKCFVNSANASDLPSNVSDSNGLLKKIKIPYEVLTDTSYKNFALVKSGTYKEGSSAEMYAHIYITNYSHTQIYKINNTASGYQSKLMFDGNSAAEYNESKSGNNFDYFTIDKLTPDYNGEYIAMFICDSWKDTAYLSCGTITVNVAHNYVVKSDMGDVKEYVCSGCGDTYYENNETTSASQEATTAEGTTKAQEATTAEGTTKAQEETTAESTTKAQEATTAESTTKAQEATTAESTTKAQEATTAESTTKAQEATTAEGTTKAQEATTAESTTKAQETTITEQKKQTTTNTDSVNITKVKKSVVKITSASKKKISKKLKIVLKSKIQKASGYQIKVYITKKSAQKNTKALKSFYYRKNSRIFTIANKKISKRNLLFARVRAYVQIGKKRYYGAWSSVKKVSVK